MYPQCSLNLTHGIQKLQINLLFLLMYYQENILNLMVIEKVSRLFTSFSAKRSDPHPEAWNKNISKVIDIFKNVRNSSEIFNFSYQILKDNNQIIPDLTKNNVLLALSSNFDELVLIALKTIPKFFKDLFNQISEDNWLMFFEKSDMKSFGIFIDEVHCVGTGMGNFYLFNALEKYFSANFKDNIERAAPLAGMYLRFLPRYVYSAEKIQKSIRTCHFLLFF